MNHSGLGSLYFYGLGLTLQHQWCEFFHRCECRWNEKSAFSAIDLTLPHHKCEIFHRCEYLWNEKSTISCIESDAFTLGCEFFTGMNVSMLRRLFSWIGSNDVNFFHRCVCILGNWSDASMSGV